jgi:hypothetical protein
MKHWKLVLAGVVAAGFAGSAALAHGLHHMTVALPDGGSAIIDYAGPTPPRVQFVPGGLMQETAFPLWSPFAELSRMSAEMDRMAAQMMPQMDALMAAADHMAAARPNDLYMVGSHGIPAGGQVYQVVSTMNGNSICTRETRITSTGHGAPQIATRASGNCAAAGSSGSGAAAALPNAGAPLLKARMPVQPEKPAFRAHI